MKWQLCFKRSDFLKSFPSKFVVSKNTQFNLFEKSKIHPYFASYHPSIPGTLIEWITKKNDIILDPFCGSGTTLIQSELSARTGIGIDANPLACLISKVRTTPIPEKNLTFNLILQQIEKEINEFYQNGEKFEEFMPRIIIPKIPNLDKWFKKNVQIELGLIKNHIDKIKNKDIQDFLKVIFSNIIVKVSNQSHETQYCTKEKIYNSKDAFNLFKKKIEIGMDEIKSYNKLIKTKSCKIICGDLRNKVKLESQSINAIITSPPYLNAWDYHLYQRFRLFWLGFEPKDLREIEIGAHLTHYQNPNAIQNYTNDMSKCFSNFNNLLKKNGKCCIVIGDSIINKKVVNVGNILIKIAKEYGFSCEKNYRQIILGPHHSQPDSINKKYESILILSKN